MRLGRTAIRCIHLEAGDDLSFCLANYALSIVRMLAYGALITEV